MKKIFPFLLMLLVIASCGNDDDLTNVQIGGCDGVMTVTDIDGNVYPIIKVGTQCWMAENLKTTRFSNGSSIQNITNGIQWRNSGSPAWCHYDNNIENGDTFGVLYNWFAISSTSRICPYGWRVPDHFDFLSLDNFIEENASDLNGSYLFGVALMSEGTINNGNGLWDPNNFIEGDNRFGLNVKPSGIRSGGQFARINKGAWFWTVTNPFNFDSFNRRYWSLINGYFSYEEERKTDGMSCRCIKNN